MMTKLTTLVGCMVALLWVGGAARAESGDIPAAAVTDVEAVAAEADAMENGAGEAAMAAPETTGNPIIEIVTSEGTIKAELWEDKAPKTVANFIQYAESQFFDGTLFHRVITNFMIQGGGFTPDMNPKPTKAPVVNEARADVPHVRGTLAMARTDIVDSATSQFFINLVDNHRLDHRDRSVGGFGYCVFGRVTEGMDVVDRIGSLPTVVAGHASGGMMEGVPQTPILIKHMRVLAR